MRTALNLLVALAILYTLYFARSLLMPIVVALLVALMLSPAVELLKRVRVPRLVSALLLLTVLGGPFVLLSVELAAPAQKWAAQLPELSVRLTRELTSLEERITPSPATPPAQVPRGKSWFNPFGWFDDEPQAPPPAAAPEKGSALVEQVKKGGMEILLAALGAAPSVLAQFALWLILLLFLLIFGPGLYASFIDSFSLARDRRRAGLIFGKVRRQLSRYILAVTVVNAGLGAVTACALWLLGVEDALLWGAMVALLNYAPYVGPVIAMCVLGIAGITQYGLELAALLPASVFFFINLLEAQFVTPTLLGQHMRLNPLILILWLMLWGWLWGAVGVLLAVPLLVCLKLVAVHLDVVPRWVQVIETRA